jgi:hypothetical protein
VTGRVFHTRLLRSVGVRSEYNNSGRLLISDVTGKSIWKGETTVNNEFFFEPSSKRRKGFPSETKVKRGFPYGWRR